MFSEKHVDNNKTFLHLYACEGEYKNVKHELEKNVNPNIQNAVSETPLQAAARVGQVDVLQLLLEQGADIYLKDQAGCNALSSAFTSLLLALTDEQYKERKSLIPGYKMICKLLLAYSKKNPIVNQMDGLLPTIQQLRERYPHLSELIDEISDPKNWPSLISDKGESSILPDVIIELSKFSGIISSATQCKNNSVRAAAMEALGVVCPEVCPSEILKTLSEALQDKDDLIRITAIQALGELGCEAVTPETLEILEKMMRDKNPLVRQAVVRTLNVVKVDSVTCRMPETLMKALGGQERSVRSAAIRLVLAMGSKSASRPSLQVLAVGIRSEDILIRRTALRVLKKLGSDAGAPGVLSALPGLLQDRDLLCKRAAIDLLGEFGPKAATDEVLEVLVKMLLEEKDKIIRREVVENLGELGPTVATSQLFDTLMKIIRDEDLGLRWRIMCLLAKLGPEFVKLDSESVSKALIEAQKSKDLCIEARYISEMSGVKVVRLEASASKELIACVATTGLRNRKQGSTHDMSDAVELNSTTEEAETSEEESERTLLFSNKQAAHKESDSNFKVENFTEENKVRCENQRQKIFITTHQCGLALGFGTDSVQKIKNLKAAAQKGDAGACYKLTSLYFEGDSNIKLTQDLDASVEYATLGAKASDSLAFEHQVEYVEANRKFLALIHLMQALKKPAPKAKTSFWF